MELTTRIFVILMIVAAGLGAGAALGKAHFNAGPGGQETAIAAEEDSDYLPGQNALDAQDQIPSYIAVRLFGEFEL